MRNPRFRTEVSLTIHKEGRIVIPITPISGILCCFLVSGSAPTFLRFGALQDAETGMLQQTFGDVGRDKIKAAHAVVFLSCETSPTIWRQQVGKRHEEQPTWGPFHHGHKPFEIPFRWFRQFNLRYYMWHVVLSMICVSKHWQHKPNKNTTRTMFGKNAGHIGILHCQKETFQAPITSSQMYCKYISCPPWCVVMD